MLLEKAYAKLYESYDNIVAGIPSQALNDITGAPTHTYYHKDHPDIVDMLLDGERN